MYLRGSKFNMTRRKKGSNPFRILFLMVLAGVGLYFAFFIVPETTPLFIPTPTFTRAPESYVSDAEALAGQGKYTQAIQAYRLAIQNDPRNAGNHISLARLYLYTTNYKEAVTSAENALVINANNSMAQAIRGYALGSEGDDLGAEGALQKAIELDASNPYAYAYYTEVLVMEINDEKNALGALDKAKEYSRTAQNLGPDLMETHRARGVLLENTANYEEAAAEFSAAITINPNIADLHLALGRNYRQLQQYPKAIEEFNRANALNPLDPLANTYISRTYLSTGDYAKAIQYAQAAIKISPTDPYLYGNLGVAYKQYKKYNEAIEPLKLAVRGGTTADGQEVKGIPLDYNIRIMEYYYSYGIALARTGACGEALQISQLIQQAVPDDEDSVYNAQEMVKICQEQVSGTATPTKASPASTSTPKP